MKLINTFQDLLETIGELRSGWIYFDGGLQSLESAHFLALDTHEDRDVEVIDGVEQEIPRVAREHGMRQLLDVATLQSAIKMRRRSIPNATHAQIAEAIRYYIEKDDFLD